MRKGGTDHAARLCTLFREGDSDHHSRLTISRRRSSVRTFEHVGKASLGRRLIESRWVVRCNQHAGRALCSAVGRPVLPIGAGSIARRCIPWPLPELPAPACRRFGFTSKAHATSAIRFALLQPPYRGQLDSVVNCYV